MADRREKEKNRRGVEILAKLWLRLG
ncbi:hypothetical protein A2U01_0116258, partial [Trifolium medium]|nr:hypothetical protein [Trifolium medium]